MVVTWIRGLDLKTVLCEEYLNVQFARSAFCFIWTQFWYPFYNPGFFLIYIENVDNLYDTLYGKKKFSPNTGKWGPE